MIAWWREIHRKLDAIIGNQDDDRRDILLELKQQRKLLMALQDDLASAVAGIQQALATEHAAVAAEIAALEAALTNAPPSPLVTAVETAIANLQTATQTSASDAAALAASLPVPPPAPGPVSARSRSGG